MNKVKSTNQLLTELFARVLSVDSQKLDLSKLEQEQHALEVLDKKGITYDFVIHILEKALVLFKRQTSQS